MTSKLIHSMIRVLDDVRSIEFYDLAFGLKVSDRFDYEGFSLIYLRNDLSTFELELTYNHDKSEPYDLGNGYGHLAFSVASLADEHARLSANGIVPGEIRDFKYRDSTLAKFFFVSDPDGYKIEIIERNGRYL
jgi:lactoylglutathione lyase